MSNVFIRCCLGILLLPLALVAHPFDPDLRPARSVKLDPSVKLVLAIAGKPQCEIVVEPKAPSVVRFAAEELAACLERVIGGKVPIVRAPGGQAVPIILGDNARSQAAGLSSAGLPRDAFIIRSVSGAIHILGIDSPELNAHGTKPPWQLRLERGTLFGVYAFLERFADAGFYFPGEIGTVLPANPDLAVPGMDILDRPDMVVRRMSPSGIWYDDDNQSNLNYARLRMFTDYVPNCHGLGRMAYRERFAQSHPEYFAMMPTGARYNDPSMPHTGQLCFNSGITEEIYQDARSYLLGEGPEVRKVYHDRYKRMAWDQSAVAPGYFNVMPQDGMYLCQCEACKPVWAQGKQATSDFVWKLTCDWANRLKAEGIPGYVTQMAYSPYSLAPAFDIPDNVLVMVAVQGPWTERVAEARRLNLEKIREWHQKLGRKVWLWTYILKYGGANIPGVPISTPRAVGRFYKEVAPMIFGAYIESGSDFYAFQVLNIFVFSKIMWDSSTDIDALLDKTYSQLFGPGAPAMTAFFDQLEDTWLGKVMGQISDTPVGPKVVPPSANDLWNKIYNAEYLQNLDALLSRAASAPGITPLQQRRVAFFRQHYYDILHAEREKFFGTQRSVEKLAFTSLPLGAGEAIALDGALGESAWQTAQPIVLRAYPDAKQKGADFSAIEVRTTVRSRHDDRHLYFAIEAEEPEIASEKVEPRTDGDDKIWQDSGMEFFINASGDRNNYFHLICNTLGNASGFTTRMLGSRYESTPGWKSGAIIRTQRLADRWTMEIALPLDALQLTPGAPPFPVNICRSRYLRGRKDNIKLYTWSPFVTRFHDPENFGRLAFTPIATDNLLADGTFAVAAKGRRFGAWITSAENVAGDTPAISLDDKIFVTEGNSLRLTSAETRSVNITQYLDIQPDTEYTLSFFLRTAGMNGQGSAFVHFNDAKNTSYPSPGVKTDMPWTRYSFTFRSHADTGKKHRPYLRLHLQGPGQAWFDWVSLEKTQP